MCESNNRCSDRYNFVSLRTLITVGKMDTTSTSDNELRLSDLTLNNFVKRIYICTTLDGDITGRIADSDTIHFKHIASTQKRLLNDSDQTIYTRHLYASTNDTPIPVTFEDGGQSGLMVWLELSCGNKKPTCTLSSDYDSGYNHCTQYFDCLEDHPKELTISNSPGWQYNGWVDAHFTDPLPKDPSISPLTMSDILGMCDSDGPPS